MNLIVLGAVLGALSVVAGAFGAHALKAVLPPALLATYETAVRYQFFHALALLFIGREAAAAPRPGLALAAGLLVAGVAIFSGSLYALVLTRALWWGAVTPVGGVCLILGWLALARAAWGTTPRP